METKNLIEYLTTISNDNLYLNFGMHLLIIASLASIFLIKGSKPRQYVLEGTLLILFSSVTIHALIFGNPFHAITFGIMSITAGYALTKIKTADVTPQNYRLSLRTLIAFILIILGLWYPELTSVNHIESLLLSPVGVIPCPTLIVTLGMMNLFSTYTNKKQFFVTVFFGILYGFIGTFKLGVYFDVALIFAALISLLGLIMNKEPRRKTAQSI